MTLLKARTAGCPAIRAAIAFPRSIRAFNGGAPIGDGGQSLGDDDFGSVADVAPVLGEPVSLFAEVDVDPVSGAGVASDPVDAGAPLAVSAVLSDSALPDLPRPPPLRRSTLAQPEPLNTTEGAVMALRIWPPQAKHIRALSSWTP